MPHSLTSTTEVVGFNTAAQQQASKLLTSFFDSILALASKPSFTLSGNKVVIHMFYYTSSGDKALSNSAINSLGKVLSKLFKAEVELRLVKLHYPYLNSYILAQYIAINTGKYNFTRIISRLWAANVIFSPSTVKDSNSASLLVDNTIPAYITGIKVKVSGRLVTQRSVPRQTVQTAQVGTFSTAKVEMASFTSKNKKGAFTVKVWIGQDALAKA